MEIIRTLISLSGIWSAKRLARTLSSSSSRRGIEWAAALRFDPGKFFCATFEVLSLPLSSALTSDGASSTSATFLHGKKHLKMPSACHFVAFVKFTQTSIRPGRLSAGSRRSMWFVVANRSLMWEWISSKSYCFASLSHLPSAAATPSRAFRRPLRLNVEPSEPSESLSLSFFEEEDVDVGAPVDFSSRETPRVNAASKSSRRRMHLRQECH